MIGRLAGRLAQVVEVPHCAVRLGVFVEVRNERVPAGDEYYARVGYKPPVSERRKGAWPVNIFLLRSLVQEGVLAEPLVAVVGGSLSLTDMACPSLLTHRTVYESRRILRTSHRN